MNVIIVYLVSFVFDEFLHAVHNIPATVGIIITNVTCMQQHTITYEQQ